MRRKLLSTLLLLSITACSGSSDPFGPDTDRLPTPDLTNLVETDMTGFWHLSSVTIRQERRGPNQVGGPAPGNKSVVRIGVVATDGAPQGRPLVGQEIFLGDQLMQKFCAKDLRPKQGALPAGEEIYRYLNQYTRQVVLYDLHRGSPRNSAMVDGGSSRLQFALGAVSETQLKGLIAVFQMGLVNPPGTLIQGVYEVTFTRGPAGFVCGNKE